MAELVYLADLLCTGRAGQHVVATRGDASHADFATFERDTAAWHGAFSAHAGTRCIYG